MVDTSIIASALIGKRRPSREVLRKCLLDEYEPLISNALFNEIEDVISRERIIKAYPLPKKRYQGIGKCILLHLPMGAGVFSLAPQSQ